MKKIIYLTLFAVLGISGCVSYDGYDTSFEKQYKMLEKETKNMDSKDLYDENKKQADDKRYMTEGDRYATVQIEAQKERRAGNKVVSSNYYFEVYPDRKETYSYNQYNEVWSDAYPQKQYKVTDRLWKKPKKYKPEDFTGVPDEGAITEEAIAAAEEKAAQAEQEAAEADADYE